MEKFYKPHIFGKKAEIVYVDVGTAISEVVRWRELPTLEEIEREWKEDVPVVVALNNARLADEKHFNETKAKIGELMIKREQFWPYIRAARALYAKTRKPKDYDFYLAVVDMQSRHHHNLQAYFAELGVEVGDFDFEFHSRLEEEPKEVRYG